MMKPVLVKRSSANSGSSTEVDQGEGEQREGTESASLFTGLMFASRAALRLDNTASGTSSSSGARVETGYGGLVNGAFVTGAAEGGAFELELAEGAAGAFELALGAFGARAFEVACGTFVADDFEVACGTLVADDFEVACGTLVADDCRN